MLYFSCSFATILSKFKKALYSLDLYTYFPVSYFGLKVLGYHYFMPKLLRDYMETNKVAMP